MIARTRASAAQSVFAAKYLVNALHTRIGLCHEPAVWLHRVTLCSGECTLLPSDGEQTSPPATEAQPESEFGACQSSSGQSGQSVGTLARDCCYWRVSGTCPCTCACGVVCMHRGRGRSRHQLRTDRRVRSEVSRYQQLKWCITGQVLSVRTRWAPARQRRGVCRVSQPSCDAASATRVPLAKPPSSHGNRKHESLGAADGGRGSCADAKLRGVRPRVGPTLGSEGVSARSRPLFEPTISLSLKYSCDQTDTYKLEREYNSNYQNIHTWTSRRASQHKHTCKNIKEYKKSDLRDVHGRRMAAEDRVVNGEVLPSLQVGDHDVAARAHTE